MYEIIFGITNHDNQLDCWSTIIMRGVEDTEFIIMNRTLLHIGVFTSFDDGALCDDVIAEVPR